MIKPSKSTLTTWAWGEKRRLAKKAGLSESYICDLLARRRRAHPDTAEKIVAAATELGKSITVYDLIYTKKTKNPLFKVLEN